MVERSLTGSLKCFGEAPNYRRHFEYAFRVHESNYRLAEQAIHVLRDWWHRAKHVYDKHDAVLFRVIHHLVLQAVVKQNRLALFPYVPPITDAQRGRILLRYFQAQMVS